MSVSIKLKGVDEELARMEEELVEFLNQEMRSRLLQALADLKRTTPVDTGRARNSWLITDSPTDYNNSVSSNSLRGKILTPASKTKFEQFYITNGVTYIDKLNAGSSKQAPSRFVEAAILRYFDDIELVYR